MTEVATILIGAIASVDAEITSTLVGNFILVIVLRGITSSIVIVMIFYAMFFIMVGVLIEAFEGLCMFKIITTLNVLRSSSLVLWD